MNCLTIAYEEFEDDEFGWLEIRLEGRFAGEAGFYGRPDVLREFADQLSAFPIQPTRLPIFDNDNVVLQVAPQDSTGHLWLLVRLTEFYDRADTVNVRLSVTYAGLQELQRAIWRFIEAPLIPLEIELR